MRRSRVAHALSRAADDLVERGVEHRHAARLDHLGDAPHAEPAGGDLGEIVAAALLGHARVEQQQIEQVVLQLALRGTGGSTGMRSAFLVDLGRPPAMLPGAMPPMSA